MSDWQPNYSAGLSAPSSPHRPTESMEIQSHWRSSPLHPDNQYGANYYANNKKSKFSGSSSSSSKYNVSSGSSSTRSRAYLIIFIFLLLLVGAAVGTLVALGYINLFSDGNTPSSPAVGAHSVVVGWTGSASPMPPITVNYSTNVVFQYSSGHTVTKLAGNDCNLAGSVTLSSSGPYVWQANTPGVHYFGCALNSHCTNINMFQQITVLPPPPTPSSSSSTGSMMPVSSSSTGGAAPQVIPVTWTFNGVSPTSVALRVGDSLVFNFASGSHDVTPMTTSTCGSFGSILSNTSPYTWTATATGTFWFGCSIGSHCSAGGMFITVTVS